MEKLRLEESSDEEESTEWQHQLQASRLLLVENVDYERCSSALLSRHIIDQDDHEEIQNRYINPTAKKRMNYFVDKLLKKGSSNYDKFLEILGAFYPSLYRSITHEEPTSVPDLIPKETSNNHDNIPTSHVLSEVFDLLARKKKQCEDLQDENIILSNHIEELQDEVSVTSAKCEEIAYKGDRYDSLVHDMAALRQVVDNFKAENSKLYKRLVDALEDNSQLREREIALRLESDQQLVSIRQMQVTVDSEKSQSFRLKKKLKSGPSEQLVTDLYKQIAELKIQLVHNAPCINVSAEDVDNNILLQVQKEKEEAIRMYKESLKEINSLREKCFRLETHRDELIGEAERLRFTNTALEEDCKMYQSRRDVVWSNLQEVEKEREQAIKERNEAQLMAQTYMGEKAKYRIQIKNLEEIQDQLSRKFRDQENQIMLLKGKKKLRTVTWRNGEHSNEKTSDTKKSVKIKAESPTPTPAPRPTSQSPELQDTPSSSIRRNVALRRENRQKRQTFIDGQPHQIHVDARVLKTDASIVGGNDTGIFFDAVVQDSSLEKSGITAGMELIRVETSTNEEKQIFQLKNCTLENFFNILQQFDEMILLTLVYQEKRYQQLKDLMCSYAGHSGDSFFVRCNFSHKRDGFLATKRGDVLHIVNTKPSSEPCWNAYLVDLYNGSDCSKCGKVPSYKSCVTNMTTWERQTNRNSFIWDIMQTMPGQMDFNSLSYPDDIASCNKACIPPYKVVESRPQIHNDYRPCLLLPQELSLTTGYRLSTLVEARSFDFPKPASICGTEEEINRKLSDGEILSYKQLYGDSYEVLSIKAVMKQIQTKIHSILCFNEEVISLEKFLSKLHLNHIYPIILTCNTDKQRNIRPFLLNEGDVTSAFSHIQKIKEIFYTLQRMGVQPVLINLDRCTKLDDVVQQVMEKVSDESRKLIWTSVTSQVLI